MTAGLVVFLPHAAGVLTAASSAAWLLPRRVRFGAAGVVIVLAIVMTAAWALAVLASGPGAALTALFGVLRDVAWLGAVYALFAEDGRIDAVKPLRTLFAVIAGVALAQPMLLGLLVSDEVAAAVRDDIFGLSALFRLLFDVGALVLLHNLYSGASATSRPILRWPAIGLALAWCFDLNYFAIAYLDGAVPETLGGLRGLTALPLAALPAFGVRRGNEALRLAPSRAVAFQSASLLLIGGYLLTMVAVARALAERGTTLATALQVGFTVAASLAALTVLPSRRLRGWLRVTVTKHLFQHRYDYRAEWLRFTRTVAQSGVGGGIPLEERAVKAVADIVDSPAGLLLSPDDSGRFALAARWQWPTADVPGMALDNHTAAWFERSGHVVDIDAIRHGGGTIEDAVIPAWALETARAWAMVPLIHYDRLIGVIVLASPAHRRLLDWEDFDLLRVAGQQLASYLAERSGQQALAEAARFDDFHRRIAFVMHDIKNLASQLGLLARNAERHAENPDFRADMLLTLRNSADKLNALLRRLSQYRPENEGTAREVRVDRLAAAVVEDVRALHPVELVRADDVAVMALPDPLEQALAHLVRNAIDASTAGTPVFVSVAAEPLHAAIDVIDGGIGMSADFVRHGLFKPFVSSKPGGFGLGAYEARELVRAMGGSLDVESREGVGTRFTIRLPRAAAVHPVPERISA
ncbi:XrtA/PEP-CTERM system histidine kinase PrsK [Parablastomonas sp. CN1-191]|uniref:XrtA/PEP-CTERM system histidine kinase PrsK n=1 Tax=Parablastomonas sp. CN1-191 TaxID=3400908 RepID=UPI003BF91E3C